MDDVQASKQGFMERFCLKEKCRLDKKTKQKKKKRKELTTINCSLTYTHMYVTQRMTQCVHTPAHTYTVKFKLCVYVYII